VKRAPSLPKRLLKLEIGASDLAAVLSTPEDHFPTYKARRWMKSRKIGYKAGGRWKCTLRDLLMLPRIGPSLIARFTPEELEALLARESDRKRHQKHI